MGSVSRFITVMSLVLSLGQPTLAEDWGTKSGREEALEELKDFDPSVRRSALARLAETGISEDVPYMLRLLRDDNFAVRGMADQAITGLWLRLKLFRLCTFLFLAGKSIYTRLFFKSFLYCNDVVFCMANYCGTTF